MIRFPKYSKKDDDIQALVVSLGGFLGIFAGDEMISIADEISEKWTANKHEKGRILPVTGSGKVFMFPIILAARIKKILKTVKSPEGKRPKLVLIGKSMGGCKLHKVCEALMKKKWEVDLFIGVDVSCGLYPHFQNYMESGDDAKTFPSNVKHLINFYQSEDKYHTGHIALWKNRECKNFSNGFCRDFNIDVNLDRVGLSDDLFFTEKTDKTICKGSKPVNHVSIDSDPDLIKVIIDLVFKKITR